MTPQKKAKELVDKYFIIIDNSNPLEDILKTAKQCALITVDEIINIDYWAFMESGGKQEQEYWQEVKQEIEKL